MSVPIPPDGIIVRNARLAVKRELEKKRILNQPIARFDPKSGKVYSIWNMLMAPRFLWQKQDLPFIGT